MKKIVLIFGIIFSVVFLYAQQNVSLQSRTFIPVMGENGVKPQPKASDIVLSEGFETCTTPDLPIRWTGD